jgi:NAD(P)-dependent dehydrogenase (short-subunit alcohol dehydrogenase family)
MSSQKSGQTFSFENQVAFITGANTGIGFAIASLFAASGAKLALLDRDPRILETAAAISRPAPVSLGLVGDVSKTADIQKAVRTAHDYFGRIDILVNNAGIGPLRPAAEMPDDLWDLTLAVNLRGPFLLAREVGRIMIEQGRGRIVNIASQASVVGIEGHVAYCTSKAGLLGLTKVLALEWGKYNVNVNSVSPTVVLTELGAVAWGGAKGDELRKQIPIGRFAEPHEIAAAVAFLASDAANMITGENLLIDGGYTIH